MTNALRPKGLLVGHHSVIDMAEGLTGVFDFAKMAVLGNLVAYQEDGRLRFAGDGFPMWKHCHKV